MQVLIRIDADRAAFEPDAAREVARILRVMAIESERYGLPVAAQRQYTDANGNRTAALNIED